MSDLVVYLADLRYNVRGTVFPLGIGYLTAYARQQFGEAVAISIFIEPEKLIAAISDRPPDILGLANYSWNRNINTQITAFAKAASPHTLTLMGGPCFSRDDKPWLSAFFRRNSALDFFIAGAGEFAFEELLRLVLAERQGAIGMVKEKAFPGLFYLEDGQVVEGRNPVPEKAMPAKNLDIIPSPYLSGVFDEYFGYRDLFPMVETVRGCPYACTFCCWGSRSLNKISAFSLERVRAELDFIAERVRAGRRLYFGDGNFGLLPRDLEVARHLCELRDRTGWPEDIFLYMAKNAGDRVVEIASLLRDITKVSLARQSLSEKVLEYTKRANLSDEDFARVQLALGEKQVESMVEIIYPLPGETRKSFRDGLDQLFLQVDPRKTEIRLYPAELLPGSEMASTESRLRFGIKSGWRKLSGQEGTFSGIAACEYQEIVIGTKDFSIADQAYVRKLHFLITLFLTYRLFEPIIVLYAQRETGGRIVALLDSILAEMESDSDLAVFMTAFENDTQGEFIFGDEPSADGKINGVWGEKKQQRRYNIYYALELFYGNEGDWFRAFFRSIRRIFVGQLGFDHAETDAAISNAVAYIVDFRAIASAQCGGKTEEPAGELLNHKAVSAFLAQYQGGSVVETLYSLYTVVTGGHLERMVLKSPYPV